MKHYNDDREKSMAEPEYHKYKKFKLKFIHIFMAAIIMFTLAVISYHLQK